MHAKGRPLWEFKEFGHRLYCIRIVDFQGSVKIVLLNGWKKDKAGKASEEKTEIEKGRRLLAEYEQSNKEKLP